MTTIEVGEIPFHVSSPSDASDWLRSAASRKVPVSVRFANAYCVALASKDEGYKTVLTDPRGVNFPDGTPVVWFMRRGKNEITPSRVRGPSFFELALSDMEQAGLSAFFLGASPSTVEAVVEKARIKHPKLHVTGFHSPPFAPLSEAYFQECVDVVSSARPDILWIGVGTPKQDFLSSALAERLGLPCVGVGAAFDFFAGTTREAPKMIQNSGLEWAYRLLQEPRRLWRRYLIGNIRFLASAIASSRSSRTLQKNLP